MRSDFSLHKRFCIYLQPMIPPKRVDIFFPPDWGMLRRSRRVLIFLKNNNNFKYVPGTYY